MKKHNVAKMLALGLMVGGATSALVAAQAFAETTAPTAAIEQAHRGPDFMKNVTRKVENIDNGVLITLTTTDATALEKLQKMPTDDKDHGPFGDKVTHEVTKITNGVQIKFTSSDADIVKKLQAMPPMGGMHPNFEDLNITRKVENLSNGVTITLTSDDAETVKMLQSRGGENFGFGGMRGHHGRGERHDFDNDDETRNDE